MGKVIILNGSPRAPKSNSKMYSEIFVKKFKDNCDYFNINNRNHEQLIKTIKDNNYSDLVFAFPLYADAVPVGLLKFLKELEKANIENRPTISIMINCGFYEPKQNDIAIRIMKVFAKKTGYKYGSTLKIASGEGTPSTFFKYFLFRKIKKFAISIRNKKYQDFVYTMPISRKLFLKASTIYWTRYGKRNGISKKEMSTMLIEDK